MHLHLSAAHSHSATELVLAIADAEPGLQIPEDRFRVAHVVLLESQPERRHVIRPCLFCSSDERLDTDSCEVVVGQMHFLNGGTLST